MGIKKKIRDKIYLYYLKKGMLNSINEIKEKHKTDQAKISTIISNINKAILEIKEEVDLFSKAVDQIELKYGKHSEAAEVATIFPFLNLSMLDILVLHKQYLSTTDLIEKNFICRTAAQHMYEFLEDGSKALGKQINFLGKLNNAQISLELKGLRKSFNELKSELHQPLKKLRHNVSGHKDRDIRNQLALSNSINIIDFQKNFILFMLFFISLTQLKRHAIDEIEKHQKTDVTTAQESNSSYFEIERSENPLLILSFVFRVN